jgi:hypothetical protein
MADAERAAREILGDLQDAVAAKDLDALGRLFADDVVLFGTAAANLNRGEAMEYIVGVVGVDGTVRWDWDRVVPLVSEPGLLSFAVVGKVRFIDPAGQPTGDPDVFRLTCVAVEQDGRWRLKHFQGSVPQRA